MVNDKTPEEKFNEAFNNELLKRTRETIDKLYDEITNEKEFLQKANYLVADINTVCKQDCRVLESLFVIIRNLYERKAQRNYILDDGIRLITNLITSKFIFDENSKNIKEEEKAKVKLLMNGRAEIDKSEMSKEFKSIGMLYKGKKYVICVHEFV